MRWSTSCSQSRTGGGSRSAPVQRLWVQLAVGRQAVEEQRVALARLERHAALGAGGVGRVAVVLRRVTTRASQHPCRTRQLTACYHD
jgi:hypothetical protein